ncbi:MAG: ABC transporter ATP-binding protein, partial [Candidatus Colwellbacteria bacterium]|nr:ABC transporter ATP-binding protein [Candidatus Colwellbacteria bacterium]
LDEPTASIDAEAEEKIFEHLQRLPGRRTMILVSHRFSTVRHADRIIVLDGGKLIESGTHEKLISLDGMYAHLFNLQARGYR